MCKKNKTDSPDLIILGVLVEQEDYDAFRKRAEELQTTPDKLIEWFIHQVITGEIGLERM